MPKNNNYLLISLLLLFVLVIDIVFVNLKGGLVGLFHINDENNKEVGEFETTTSISIVQKKEDRNIVYLNEPLQLTLMDNLGNRNLNGWDYTWIASDTSIVSISSTGLLIGKAEGETIIRVTNKNNVNLFDLMKITVVGKENKLRFSSNSGNDTDLILGEVRKLEIITGGDISLNEIIWSTSDPNIISVNNGYITAKSLGNAIITVTSKINANFTDKITLKVKDNSSKLESPTKVQINQIFINNKQITFDELTNKTFKIGDKLVINASTNIEINNQVTFKTISDNVEVVTNEQYVGSYIFTDTGIAKIKIGSKFNENVYQEIAIVIGNESFKVDELVISSDNTVRLNNYLNIVALNHNTLIPYDELYVKVEDETILIYDSGILCPLKVGQTKVIVCYLYDKTIKDEFTVTVLESEETVSTTHIALSNIKLNEEEYDLNQLATNQVKIGDHLTMNLEITPLNSSYYENIKIISSNPNGCAITTFYDNYEYTIEVEFIKTGYYEIYIKSFEEDIKIDKITFDCELEEKEFNFEIVRINNLVMGKTYTLRLEKTGVEPDNINYSFLSSDDNILSIGNNGDILALDEGEAIITVKASFDQKIIEKQINIKVKKIYQEYEKAEEMTYRTYLKADTDFVPIDFTTSFLNVYQKAYLVVNFNPNNSKTLNYEVISSDKEIIDIQYIDYRFQLYALKPGVATIKIICYENETLNQEFTVRVYDILPKYFVPMLESNEIVLGDECEMEFMIDKNATTSKAIFEFTNKDIIKIVGNKLLSLKSGRTTLIITINNDYDEYSISIPLKVVKNNLFSDSSSKIETIVFFIMNFFIYFVISYGIFSTQMTKKKKIIFACSLIVLGIMQALIKQVSADITYLSLLLNITGLLFGFLLAFITKKRGVKNAKE